MCVCGSGGEGGEEEEDEEGMVEDFFCCVGVRDVCVLRLPSSPPSSVSFPAALLTLSPPCNTSLVLLVYIEERTALETHSVPACDSTPATHTATVGCPTDPHRSLPPLPLHTRTQPHSFASSHRARLSIRGPAAPPPTTERHRRRPAFEGANLTCSARPAPSRHGPCARGRARARGWGRSSSPRGRRGRRTSPG